MQSETGFPSSHQLKSYVASKSRVKLAARAVLSADASLLVSIVDTCLSFEDNPTTLYAGSQMANFFLLYFQRAACSTFQTCILNSH